MSTSDNMVRVDALSFSFSISYMRDLVVLLRQRTLTVRPDFRFCRVRGCRHRMRTAKRIS